MMISIFNAIISPCHRLLLFVALTSIALPITTATSAETAETKAKLALPGLEKGGEIIIDGEGIPHITAKRVSDGCLLLGYVQAKDRFWQIDSSRRLAAGTLAELLGPDALQTDGLFRTARLRAAAEASRNFLEAETKSCLEAYAKGVNNYILDPTNPLPAEYEALGLGRDSIRPWEVVDSLLILKLLAFSFVFSTADLDRTNGLDAYLQAGAAHGFDGQTLFFEDVARIAPFDPTNATSIPDFFKRLNMAVAASAEQAGINYSPLDNLPIERLFAPQTASNWVIVSGQYTANNQPLLAYDAHLSHTVPSQFYEFQLRVTGRDGFDLSVGGIPGTLVAGYAYTDFWASGVTVFLVDALDIYQETLILDAEGQPTHVLFEGEQVPLTIISETLRANQDGSVEVVDPDFKVRIVPHHGPLLAIEGTTGFSFRAVFLDAARDVNAFLPLAHARTPEQFADALRNYQDLYFNFGYVDVNENIGYFTTGAVPLREDLQLQEAVDETSPLLVRDGTGTQQHEWLPLENPEPARSKPYQLLPFEEMPQILNPDRGFILNANNDPVGLTLDNDPFNQLRPGGGVYYLNDFYSDRRVSRLYQLVEQRIADGGKIDVDDLQEIQADNVERTAQFFVPYIVQALANATCHTADPTLAGIVDAKISEAVARLENWDLNTPTGIQAGYDTGDDPDNLPEPSPDEIDNSVATTLYYTWLGRFKRNVIADTLAEFDLPLPAGTPRVQSTFAVRLLRILLEDFAAYQGRGAAGVDFFAVAGIPAAEDRRDYLILKSLRDALSDLSSAAFAAAFANSTNQEDYRWGLLHRIVFPHRLGGSFNIPPAGGFSDLDDDLPGIAKDGGEQTVDTADCNNGFDLFGTDDCMFSRGPQNRFIAQVGRNKKITAINILPGGQSGDVNSPFYANQLGRWLTKQYRPVLRKRGEVRKNAIEILRFRP